MPSRNRTASQTDKAESQDVKQAVSESLGWYSLKIAGDRDAGGNDQHHGGHVHRWRAPGPCPASRPRSDSPPESGSLSQADFKMLTNVRVGVIRAALQLTSEQEKLWPAEGEVIRSGAGSRYRRLT